MKRKGTLLTPCESSKKHKSEDTQVNNVYNFFNLSFPDRSSAIKENISLPNSFYNLEHIEKINIFKNVILQFHGWYLTDEIEFYNKNYEYSYFNDEIKSKML